MPTIGKYIKILRLSKNFRLQDLSVATKISQSQLSRIESDKRIPTLKQIKEIASFFEIPEEYFQDELIVDKIVSLLKRKKNYKELLNNAETKLTDMSNEKKYFIRKTGKNESPIYNLIQVNTYNMIDMFFSTKEEAEKYALDHNIELVNYEE